MRSKASFAWLFIPLAIYLALMTVLYFERTGASYDISESELVFLDPSARPLESGYTDPPAETLVLYDTLSAQERTIDQMVTNTLDIMRVKYDLADMNTVEPGEFRQYRVVVLAFVRLDRFAALQELVDWVETGGRVLVASYPGSLQNNTSFYRKIGIRTLQDEQAVVLGFAFASDFMPGAMGMRLEGAENFLVNNSYPVQLDAGARVHLTSADEYELPLLWEKDYGQGRFVVINTDAVFQRVNRGIMGAAYSLLEDVFVYPVINSSVLFVDDFPAPIPAGENPAVTQEFNRDVRSFMLNVWWPDMRKLAEKYGLKYTGLLIETYNDKVVPPFELDVSVDDHRYMGQMLLWTGGEIGLHGYNHVPLCLEKDGINQASTYPAWPSQENGQLAITELDRFGRSLFPRNSFTVYVPPSNILCAEAREWLPKVLPGLKVISSLSFEEEDAGTYMQNFGEAADGIVEFPRIVSGFQLYEAEQLALINELGLHYVNSHFIHPDDILDPVRRDNRTWAVMLSQIDSQYSWLRDNAPGLRSQTASEGAMAVQRFSRLKVNAQLDGDRYVIHLGGFHDQAFLMMRAAREPASITGGVVTKVTSSLYLIEAQQPDIIVSFGDQP